MVGSNSKGKSFNWWAWRLFIFLAFASVAFVILVLALAFDGPQKPEPQTLAWIGKKLWRMPSGMGALIGASLGFLALAWATSKGYSNLKKAQENQALLDRDARMAQAKIDRDVENRRILRETRSLAAGLRGEIKFVITSLEFHAEVLRLWKADFEEMIGKDPEHAKLEMHPEFYPVPAPLFFSKNVGNIGLLGANLTADLSFSYGTLAQWRKFEERSKPIAVESYYHHLTSYANIIEQNLPWFEDLFRRLEVVESGGLDPGKNIKLPESLIHDEPTEQSEATHEP